MQTNTIMRKENNTSVTGFVPHHIALACNSLRKGFAAALKAKGIDLTPTQFAVLVKLNISEGITQKALTAYALLNGATISRTIDQLERKELAVRKRSENDHRANLVFITDKGRKLFMEAFPVARARTNNSTKGLSKDEIGELIRLLKIVKTNSENR